MIKTLSKDRLNYLQAINYVYARSDIWDDEIINDIKDTKGNFAENNKIYLCINKTELVNPDNDFIKNVANNFRKKILSSNEVPDYETCWDMAKSIFGSDEIHPQWLTDVEVKTKYPTGSYEYTVYDPNEDIELIDITKRVPLGMYQIDLNKEQRDFLIIAIGLAVNDMKRCATSPVWNFGDKYSNDGALKLLQVRSQLGEIRSRVFKRPFVLKDSKDLEIINYALIAAASCIDHLANSFVWCIAGINQEPSIRQMKARSQELISRFRNIEMEIFTQTEKETGTNFEES